MKHCFMSYVLHCASLLLCFLATVLPYYCASLLLCFLTTVLPCYCASLLLCFLATMPLTKHVKMRADTFNSTSTC